MPYYRSPPGNLSRRIRTKRLFGFNKAIVISRLLRLVFFSLIGLVIIFFLYFLWISRELPTPGKLSTPDIKDSTKILDKDGTILYSIYRDYNRIYIPLSEIPKYLKDATVATEDQDFFANQGFSFRGYGRAIKDFILYRRLTGGSTITQQLVKNVLLTPERSITRKFKELVLSIQVEQRFKKDQILEMYLNNVSFGGTAIGVEAAAALYFDKKAKDLNLSESAFLAGLPQAPSFYSPFTSEKKAYINRTSHVLKRMREEGIISKQQERNSLKAVESLKFTRKQGHIKAPHFVMYVRDQLIKMYGESMVENGNLEVKTTLDYDIQKKAEEIVHDEIEKLKNYKVGNGAAVVLDPQTGAILAMVGSRDYFDIEREGNFNAATALRQPGSSLKPIMYAVAFEKGYSPSTLLMDTKTEFPVIDAAEPIYKPENYDGKYHGPVQLRFALGNSINVPAVKMLSRVGIKPVMQRAYEMGIENWKPTQENLQNVGLSLVLGGREASLLQMSSAFSVFANEGVKQEPFAIVEVKDAKGKTIYKHQEQEGAKVLSREVSFLVSHILLDNNARELVFGRNSWLNISGRTVSAKTGTTDKKRDNWTIGYNKFRVVGVWVGNNDNAPMNPTITSGVTGAAPIWNRIMQYVLKNLPNEEFGKPDGVEAVEIDSFGGGLPVEGQAKRTEYFIKGTQPTTSSPIYKKVKISKHQSEKLANEEEIKRGDYDVREYIVFVENDPVSTDGENRWQKGITEWLDKNHKDDPKYKPPTEVSNHTYSEEPTAAPTSSQADGTPTPTPTSTPSVTPTPTP